MSELSKGVVDVLDNITYTYGMGTPFEKTALRGVSLTIENG